MGLGTCLSLAIPRRNSHTPLLAAIYIIASGDRYKSSEGIYMSKRRLRKSNGMRNVWMTLVWLLLAASLPAVVPVTPMAADVSLGQAELAMYNLLQANVRPQAGRSYEMPAQPTVFLTFDDGPSALTADVLRILQQEQVAATFFVLGQYANANPEMIRRIVAEGHAIGNHTYDHVYAKLYGSFGEFWRQVQQTEAVLERQADVRTRLLRAPGGTFSNFDAFYYYYLEQAGYVVTDWNVDSGDSKRPGVPAAEIVKNATNLTYTSKTPNEIVVLMHDGVGHSETIKALPDIIQFYKSNGYSFASLTPDIYPIQSSLGKLKWKRSADIADYARYAELAKEHAALWQNDDGHGAEQQAGGVDALPDTDISALSAATYTALTPSTPLSIYMGTETLKLEGDRYAFRNDRFYVPLRALVESMGGSVEWREESRQAVVSYGLRRITYDLSEQSITSSAPGTEDKRLVLADISLIDSKLIVPLRQTVELLGGGIESYSLEGDSREVRLQSAYSLKI